MAASIAHAVRGPRVVATYSAAPAARGAQRDAAVAVAALAALSLLALTLDDSRAVRAMDRRVRRLASRPMGRRVDRAMAPLFPVGLPGVYIPVAHVLAWWSAGRGARQAWRLPATAWAAWLAHRGVKLVFERERPRGRDPRGKRRPRRVDSYPSGHTTGVTALCRAIDAILGELDRGDSATSSGVRAARAVARGAPLVMGLQRIVADDHWASDVLGGLALGTAVARACSACAALAAGEGVRRSRSPRVRSRRPGDRA